MPAAPAPVSIGYAIGLPPKDAIAYLESKGYAITFDWRELWQDAQAQAFTVANVARLDILQDIRGALQTALRTGKTEKWFAETLTPTLKEKGWWGQRIDVDESGGAGVVQQGSPTRLNLIYRQNLQSAYMAGRYKEQLENADERPYWEMVVVLDARTRHGAMSGLIYRYDDQFWVYFYPPNGFGCRCRVRTHPADAQGVRSTEEEGGDSLVTREVETLDRRTGEMTTRQVTALRFADGREVATDLGFSYNPGAAAFGTDMDMARKLSTVQDAGLRAEAVQALNNSPLRQAQFARQVDAALDARRASHSAMTVGFVDADIVEFVKEKGHAPASILLLPEKQLLHADRQRHHTLGINLTRDEWKKLPALVAKPERVLWDKTHSSVVYVCPTGNPETRLIIAAEMPAQGKRKKSAGNLDAVVNGYITPLRNLSDTNKFEPIRG